MLPSIGDKLIFLTQLIAAMALVLAAYAGGAFLVTRLLSRLKGAPNAECAKDSVRSIDWKEWYVSFTLGGFILWGWAVFAFAQVRSLRIEKIAATWEGAAAYGRETIAGLCAAGIIALLPIVFQLLPRPAGKWPILRATRCVVVVLGWILAFHISALSLFG